MQDQYCERHSEYFDESEENKLEYTSIFEGFVRIRCFACNQSQQIVSC
jgi:hypothetical protein